MDIGAFRKQLRHAQKLVIQIKNQESNEAETRRHIDKVLELLCGYDALKHLTREHSIRGPGDTEFADFVIRSEDSIDIVVEIKRADLTLTPKHVKQGSRYCFDLGCSWMVLTNAVEWRLYKVLFSQPSDVVLVATWDILADDPHELAEKFDLISLRSIRKKVLDKYWHKKSALREMVLLSAILSEQVLITIRKVLRKKTGVLVHSEDLVSSFRKLLNERASACIDEIDITLPIKKSQPTKKTTVQETNPQAVNRPVVGNDE